MAREYDVRVVWSRDERLAGCGYVRVVAVSEAAARRAALRQIRATTARYVNRSRQRRTRFWTEQVQPVRKGT